MRLLRLLIPSLAVITGGLWWFGDPAPLQTHPVEPAALAAKLESLTVGPVVTVGGTPVDDPGRLADFYAARNHEAAWVGPDRAWGPDAVLETLRGARGEGLDPADFHLPQLEALLVAPADPADAAELELLLSDALLSLASAYAGRAPHRPRVTVDPVLGPGLPDPVASVLDAAAGETDPASALASLLPGHRDYRELRRALPTAPEAARPAMVATMERMRELSRELSGRYVLVNIPQYHLELRDGDAVTRSMIVIVGREDRRTPRFSDRIQVIVVNPRWTVPPGIQRNDILPAVRKDRGYLAAKKMRVLRGYGSAQVVVDPATVDWSDPKAIRGIRFEQTAGPHNALGRIKFLFPNEFAVYAHDTPDRRLFEKKKRALSSGCVRLSDPSALALDLLPDWTAERLEAAIGSGSERSIRLADPVPIHLVYWTARVDADGTVTTYEDVYGLDAEVAGPHS